MIWISSGNGRRSSGSIWIGSGSENELSRKASRRRGRAIAIVSEWAPLSNPTAFPLWDLGAPELEKSMRLEFDLGIVLSVVVISTGIERPISTVTSTVSSYPLGLSPPVL